MPAKVRDILSQLGGLSRQKPSAADAATAVGAARAALLARQSRRRWLRISIPSGIAACLVAAALLVFFTQTGPTAHASEHFQQAVQSAREYQGWVQVVATPRSDISVPGRGKLVSITCRSNAAEGLYGEVRQYQNNLEMTFCAIKQHSISTYNSTTGEIRHRALGKQDDDDQPRDLLLPACVGDTLAVVKNTLGHDAAALKPERDGDDLRVDVTLFGSHDEENEFHRRNASARMTPARFSVWINSQNVITRMACDSMGGTLESSVTYGASPVTSIYDLGAPKNAPIIETRPRERGHDND